MLDSLGLPSGHLDKGAVMVQVTRGQKPLDVSVRSLSWVVAAS